MSLESDLAAALERITGNARAEIEAATAAARAEVRRLADSVEPELATLFPVSLLWAHKGLLVLVGLGLALAAALGHAAG